MLIDTIGLLFFIYFFSLAWVTFASFKAKAVGGSKNSCNSCLTVFSVNFDRMWYASTWKQITEKLKKRLFIWLTPKLYWSHWAYGLCMALNCVLCRELLQGESSEEMALVLQRVVKTFLQLHGQGYFDMGNDSDHTVKSVNQDNCRQLPFVLEKMANQAVVMCDASRFRW